MEKNKHKGYAGFWVRIFAFIIDFLFYIPLIIILVIFKDHDLKTKALIVMTGNIILYGYLIVMPIFYGGTVGKLVMKIRIKDGADNNIRCLTSCVRQSPYILTSVVTIFLMFVPNKGFSSVVDIISQCFIAADVLFLIFSPKKRSIHDYIAGTYVYNVK